MSLAPINPSDEQDVLFALAACLGADPEIFYVEKGGSSAEAKSICKKCPVEDQCLDYALEHHELHGIWGGRSQPELRILRRERRRATVSTSTSIDGDVRLPKAEKTILNVLAQFPDGRARRQLALLSGYSSTSGGFNNALSKLRTAGLINKSGEPIKATTEGFATINHTRQAG